MWGFKRRVEGDAESPMLFQKIWNIEQKVCYLSYIYIYLENYIYIYVLLINIVFGIGALVYLSNSSARYAVEICEIFLGGTPPPSIAVAIKLMFRLWDPNLNHPKPKPT